MYTPVLNYNEHRKCGLRKVNVVGNESSKERGGIIAKEGQEREREREREIAIGSACLDREHRKREYRNILSWKFTSLDGSWRETTNEIRDDQQSSTRYFTCI